MSLTKQKTQIDIVSEAKSILDIDIEAMENFRDSLDKTFEDAIRMVHECPGKVVVTGVGKSGIIAKKIAGTLSSLGTLAIFLHPGDALHGDLGIIQSKDIVLAIAKSGESDELLAMLPSIRAIGANIISIVGNADSKLAQASDVAIIAETEKEACSLNLAPTTSSTLSLVAGDAMAIILAKLKGFKSEDYAKFHPAGTLGKRLLLKVSDLMHTGNKNPVVDEKMLIKDALMEMTTKAMGALEVVDSDGILKGLVTEGDLRRGIQKHQNLLEMQVTQIMTLDPTTIRPEAQAYDALTLMENRPSQISVLPVVDHDNRAIGILRLHDLVNVGL
jgi:arabinose-5-phosphate isomerase